MDGNGGSGRSGRPGTSADGGPGAGRWLVPGYTHERELGAGASGLVVLARHDATGTAVAIKYLSGTLGQDPRFREAFRGEAELLGGLDSPYIARFYEYVEDGPDAAIVMELVDGIALHALLRQEGATDPEPALTVLKGSLLGLAAAHAAGVVHRDYKPANVLVTPEGESKLVDFGVAVRSGESAGVAGTPSYMAPEQWAGGPATPATDVYAATATFYECLTGSKPYSGSTMFELAVQHAEAPIPNEQVPEQVRPLVSRGLAKTPLERPQSAADFVAELQAVATAAYGADWEERGQRKLAALVALLPLLLPSAGGGAAVGTTALAHTRLGQGGSAEGGAGGAGGAVGAAVGAAGLAVIGAGAAAGAGRHHGSARRRLRRLGPRGKFVAGAVVAVLVSAGLAVTAVATGGSGSSPDAAGSTPSALTSLTSGGTSGPPVAPASGPSTGGTPTASATTSASASTSATTTASTSPTATTTPTGTGAGGGTGTPTTGATTTGPAAPPTTTGTVTTAPTTVPPTTVPPTTPPPTLHISLVAVGSISCDGRDAASASVTIRSDGAAAGTLTISWFHIDNAGVYTVVGTDSVPIPAGQASYTTGDKHTFGGRDITPTWGVSVATSPAASKGQGSSRSLSSSTCRSPLIG